MARITAHSALLITGLLVGLGACNAMVEPQSADGPIDAVIQDGGTRYEIINGAAFRVAGNNKSFIEQLYDPAYVANNYREQDGTIYRKGEGNRVHATYQHFREDFDDVGNLRDLISETHGWTNFTAQSPMAPRVRDYVALQKQVMKGGDFIDNRLTVTNARAHNGGSSLGTYAVTPSGGMETSKASLSTGLVYFANGDVIDFSAWYFIESGEPFSLVDFESSYIKASPGLRLILSDTMVPRIELKWGTKPTWSAAPGKRIMPGRWTRVRLEANLSAGPDGHMRVWLDDDLVIDASGQTLPTQSAVYDTMEIGISANNGRATKMFTDEIDVTRR